MTQAPPGNLERRTLVEAFGIIGMTFGMTALTFAIVAMNQIGSLRKEFKGLKRDLESSGVLKEQTQSEDE